jgi:multidrug efflux pump
VGVLPLVVARGAGAAGRHSFGTGVLGGMLAATAFAIFLVPVFFVLVQRATERLLALVRAPGRAPQPEQPPASEADGGGPRAAG